MGNHESQTDGGSDKGEDKGYCQTTGKTKQGRGYKDTRITFGEMNIEGEDLRAEKSTSTKPLERGLS